MKILLTAGPTREPIDPVRFIGNRSSGKMGAAIAEAALRADHMVTAIVGPVSTVFPSSIKRTDVETAEQMYRAVIELFPDHDLLVMAAAVADFRPKARHQQKIGREGALVLELEPTEDIVAAAAAMRKPSQRVVGFSLEQRGNLDRARQKLVRKNLDLIVFNPTETMDGNTIEPTLLYPDGRAENIGSRTKGEFADNLIARATELFR